jgi:hypothetical protein
VESHRFDAIVRATAQASSRRAALRALLGAAGVLAVVDTGRRSAAAADSDDEVQADGTRCRRTGANCKGKGTSTQCCSLRCKRGACVCRGKGGRCAFDSGCCSHRCGTDGRCS